MITFLVDYYIFKFDYNSACPMLVTYTSFLIFSLFLSIFLIFLSIFINAASFPLTCNFYSFFIFVHHILSPILPFYFIFPSNIYISHFLFISIFMDNQDQIKPQQDPISLEYIIANSDALCGEGNINSIKSLDSGFWKSYIGAEVIKLQCQLKNICYISHIDIKVKNVSIAEFTIYSNSEEVGNQMLCPSNKESSTNESVRYKFKKEVRRADHILIEFHSLKKKQISLHHLSIYGTIISGKKMKTSRKHNGQIFEQRQKQAVSKKISNEKLNKQIENEVKIQQEITKTNENKANSNIKKNFRPEALFPPKFNPQQFLDSDQAQANNQYSTIFTTKKELLNLLGVNQKWLQQQRKLQQTYGVLPQHRLSIKVSPKCFNGFKFCIPNIYGEEKSRYVKMIKQLGGLVREDPCEGCLVITGNPKGSKVVGIARLMVDTHILKLQYLDECYRQKSKLKYHKYQYTPEQFFI